MHPTLKNKIILGRRKPSAKTALILEKITSINRLAWLYPEEFFNPQAPHLYQGSYPPDLSHLKDEALSFAQEIIKAFPEKPPTWQEFKLFKRQYKKTKEGAKQCQG
ncbi:MAG: hypothetical protein QW472_05700 [Candidatus Aenigmatarchaeota archaeon]